MNANINAKHQAKRNEILEAFSQLVAEEGLEHASFSKLAKSMGIPQSLVFYYFKNKQDLVYEMISYAYKKCTDITYKDADRTNPDVKGEFIKFIDYVLSDKGEDEVDARVYFTCIKLGLQDEIAKQKYLDFAKENNAKLQRNLEYFMSKGVINKEPIQDAVDYIVIVLAGVQDALDFINAEDEYKRLTDMMREEIFKFLNLQ